MILALFCCNCVIINEVVSDGTSGGTSETSHLLTVADVSPHTSLLDSCSLLILIQGWPSDVWKAEIHVWLQLPMGWWALCTPWRSPTSSSQVQTSALVWIWGA